MALLLIGQLLYSFTSGLEAPCTLGQEIFHLTILTPEGEPVDSVQLNVTNRETGQEYNACKELLEGYCDQDGSDGTYIIFADGIEDDLDKGETIFVNVEGTRGDLGFTEEFTFEYDGCNVVKAAGPDTVSLQP